MGGWGWRVVLGGRNFRMWRIDVVDGAGEGLVNVWECEKLCGENVGEMEGKSEVWCELMSKLTDFYTFIHM